VLGHGRCLAVSLLFAALFVAAACGGDDGTDAYGESSPVSLEGESVTVEMRDISFQPQGIKLKVGTSVTWVNRDEVPHNVRQVESEFLSPDVMEPGQSFTFTFSNPGRFRYQCTLHHPDMNGVVIVEADE
jgi:plastocyanin